MAAATVAAVLGLVSLFLLSLLLQGMLTDAGMFLGCGVGAFVTTWAVYAPGPWFSLRGLRSSAFIVVGTHLAIASGYLMVKVIRGVSDWTTPTEAMGVFFWAAIATSWWLVPGVMATMWVFDRMIASRPIR